MDKELDDLLCRKYPELFRGRHKSMVETLMCWGFDCGNGWFKLIDDLCSEITHYCKSHNVEIPEVAQVKEKFGSLRFYLWGVHKDHFEQIYKFTDKANRFSLKTCEICGLSGKLDTNGWWRTLCAFHRKERENKNKG